VAASHTSLFDHKREGSRLRTKLADLPFKPISWERDLLPEFLWLAALSEHFAADRIHRPFYQFMDVIDEFWDQPLPPLGLLSDFAFLQSRSEEIWAKHESLLIRLFYDIVGRPLSLYPENPASWLVRADLIARDGAVNPAVELTKLRRLVVKLLPGRDGVVGQLRTLPAARLLKHHKVHFPIDSAMADIFPRYPHATSPGESGLVESACRALLNAALSGAERFKNTSWPQLFWRSNMALLPCRAVRLPIRGGRPATEAEIPHIQEVLSSNGTAAREFLENAGMQYQYDLYDPGKDEILMGLLARVVRLYILIAEDSNLWARDISAIILRCLVDTAITFSYLTEKGSDQDFRNFREYGEGQEKLLLLHLQDNYPDAASLEGRTPADISEELGGFTPELIEIELGHWTKKDARQLAKSVGMEEYYRLVYSPASNDLHGSWLSLKHSSLWRCAEPLHRYHRLPAYSQPIAYLGVIDAATQVLVHTMEVGHRVLGLPKPPGFRRFGRPETEAESASPGT
jgi:hypothetical protein